jgi:hypothetical protein
MDTLLGFAQRGFILTTQENQKKRRASDASLCAKQAWASPDALHTRKSKTFAQIQKSKSNQAHPLYHPTALR